MALRRRTGNLQTYIDDVTGALHLVHVLDGVVTDIVTYQQPDVVAALESEEAAVAAVQVAIEALPLDTVTGALLTTDVPHSKIHDEDSFLATFLDSDVDDAATINLRLAVPDTAVRIHFFPDVTGTLATTWELFKLCTHNAGTAVVAYNKEQNSSEAATLIVTHTASGGADGTKIDQGSFGDGKKSGGGERGEEEWVLDQGGIYLLKATSHANNNRVVLRARWYEHS